MLLALSNLVNEASYAHVRSQRFMQSYLEGYIQCKVTEYLLHDKVLSSELEIIKEMVATCMEQYISQQKISEVDKEETKQNHKQWAEMVW